MRERKIINKKSTRGISALIIVVIVVIAVVVVGVGVYVVTRGNGTSPGASTTPTPASTTTATPTSSSSTTTPKPTSTSTNKIATATSYEFNETGTASNGTVLDTVYYASKNIGTSNVDLIEVVTTPSSGTLEYIVNGAQQKAWVYQSGQWTDLSSEFSTILPTVQSAAGIYTNMLESLRWLWKLHLYNTLVDNQMQETKLPSPTSKSILRFQTLFSNRLVKQPMSI